jgi:hypothetical protein
MSHYTEPHSVLEGRDLVLLRALAALQALILLPILIRFLLLPPDFGAVGLWFFAIAVSVLTLPYALWHFARHPPRRGWAASMIVLAVVTTCLPLAMAQFDIKPIPLPAAGMFAVVLGLIVSIWLLARPSFWDREGWAAGRFNGVLLIVLLIWIVLVAAPLIYGLVVGFAAPLGNERNGLSLDALLLLVASVGSAGVLLAVFALLFSVIGLWRHRARAAMHGAQLVAALVLSALLALQGALVSIMMVNPG